VNGRARVELSRRTMTDSDGHYQRRIAPGEYLLYVPPVIRPSGAFQIGNETEIVRDFHLEHAAVLQVTGLVVRNAPADEPVAGAIVEGRPYGTTSGRSRFNVVADAGGRFRAERYRDPMTVVARSPDNSLAGLTFIGADDKDLRVRISEAATISGRMTQTNGKPFAEQSVSCQITVDPPNRANIDVFPPPIIRRMLTDAKGGFTFGGIPVGTRCVISGDLKIGDISHRGSEDAAANKPGLIEVPDLVLKP
jgi:hypothetical protein